MAPLRAAGPIVSCMSRLARVARTFMLVVVAAATAVPGSAIAAEWPLHAYWPLLEGRGQTVYDISGRGNHGTLGRLDTADRRDPLWIRGLLGVGSALRLDGNDYVAVPDTADLRPQRVTLEAWVRAPESPGQFKYIGAKGGDRCEAASFGLYTSINGGLAFYVYDGKRWYRSAQVSTAIWDGGWHHVAGTYDGSMVRLYVDGNEIGTGRAFSGAITYALPNGEFHIGAYRGACNLTFRGDVDEIRLWSAALPVSAIWSRINSMLDREPAAPLPEDAREWFDGG